MPSHPGGRSLWHASIDPARPAEVTGPILAARCAECERNSHVWHRVQMERFNGRVSLRRYVCRCDMCGRCDARLVKIRIDRG